MDPMADPISLSKALVEEYQAQKIEPPFPEGQLAIWRQARKAELAGRFPAGDEAAAEELEAALVKDFYAWLHQNQVRRSALCFSGGGIRSATFGLGLIQGLARCGLLRQFDFLSTVSGGGYVGSWLSAWLFHARNRGGDAQSALREIEAELCKPPDSPLDPEPQPIRHLRDYSRYMSPELGFLSADTWTLVAAFLRNLILNWLVLLPLIGAVLLIPRFSLWLVQQGSQLPPWLDKSDLLEALYWLAVAAGSVGIAYFAPTRPSLAKSKSTFPKKWQTQGWFIRLCLLPLVLMAVAITLNWAWLRADGLVAAPLIPRLRPVPLWLAFATFGVLLHGIGYWLSRFCVREFPWKSKALCGEFVVVLATGAIGGLLAYSAGFLLPPTTTPSGAALYVCFATPLLLFLFFLATVLFVGLAFNYTTDADREWMARASAWVLIAIFLRAAFSAIVIFGPMLLLEANLWLTSSVGGLSGLLTLLLGFRAEGERAKLEPADQAPTLWNSVTRVALRFAAPIFVVFFLALLALGTTLLLLEISRWFFAGPSWTLAKIVADPQKLLALTAETSGWALLVVLLLFSLVGTFFGFFVDINRFSLHGLYRDRLVRAYLGASRGDERDPNPFTGFDRQDNFAMRKLEENRPLHVVNMALNLVHGEALAWQDRKAESFTVSPLHVGNHRLGYRRAAEYARSPRTGRAISLGTAMAISGAAASPNMGYHSSPAVTFLLALFNIRLGWWLGNPGQAGAKTYSGQGPRFAPRPLFEEALGLTNDRSPYVYLSDGGHFENLALYEMVLRRCHFIVLSDAGHDPDFSFEDLGNAVAKIRVDLGVPIEFEKIALRPRSKDGQGYDVVGHQATAWPYCAIGRIRYSAIDSGGPSADGWLLYIKPSLHGTEPLDVFNYARRSPQFPHEPTSDQLYGEQQFESYRSLGAHAMDRILSGLAPGADLAALFAKVQVDLSAFK